MKFEYIVEEDLKLKPSGGSFIIQKPSGVYGLKLKISNI